MPTISTGSGEVEYLEAGEGPIVILLHSSASGLRQWRRLIEDLKGRYRCVAINLFGYGATTPWPGGRPQTLADQARLVEAVIDHIGQPVMLIGHSLGGAVSLETACRLGERLRGAIVYEPILFSLLQAHGPSALFAEIGGFAAGYGGFARAGDWDAAGRLFVDYWSGTGTWDAAPRERRESLRAMLPNTAHEWDAAMTPSRDLAGWGDIAAPIRILRAADTRRPMHAITSLLASAHPRWTLHELPEGGHMAPLSRPDLFNPLATKLLDRLTQ
jgi:pimeloyl-ACP methyl ester carboxylesterase